MVRGDLINDPYIMLESLYIVLKMLSVKLEINPTDVVTFGINAVAPNVDLEVFGIDLRCSRCHENSTRALQSISA